MYFLNWSACLMYIDYVNGWHLENLVTSVSMKLESFKKSHYALHLLMHRLSDYLLCFFVHILLKLINMFDEYIMLHMISKKSSCHVLMNWELLKNTTLLSSSSYVKTAWFIAIAVFHLLKLISMLALLFILLMTAENFWHMLMEWASFGTSHSTFFFN